MKNFTRKSSISLSAILPVLFLSVQSPLAVAQEAESDKNESNTHECKPCIRYTGWRGDLDFGLGYVTDDSLRFGDYRGLEEEGFYAAVDGDLHFRNLDGQYFDMYARDLGYDSRQLEMRGGNQGLYELRFGWQETPKYRGYGTQTPFLGVGSDFLTLPADWVPANTTGGMTALQSSLRPEALKTQRKTLDAGVTLKFAHNWSVRADYQRQKKEGVRTLGAGLYFNNSSILPAPVDFTTDQFDMGLSWAGKRAQVEIGFIGSYFDNGESALTWQNPFSASPEHQAFRAALEPDNEFYQFNLSAAFALTPRIRLSGQAVMGRMSQDEAFLPYTINPSYSDLVLPRESLDGKVDVSTYNLTGKLSARLSKRLSFTARGKWDERENKTPVDTYTPVVTDLLPVVERYNLPYSYKRQQYSADLRWRAFRVLRLSAGGRQQNIDRSLQAVERTEETTWWGEAKWSPWHVAQLRFKLESADRDVSDYLQPDHGGPVDHPLFRKFNQADRVRDRVLVELDLMPAMAVGINLSYFKASSDYENSDIGLQESDDESWTINLSYAAGSKVNIYAFLTRDDIDADLINTAGNSSMLWNAVTRDRISTFGIGLSSEINEKSSIGVDLVSSDSKGDISVQTSLEEEPFDTLKTELTNLTLHYDYRVSEHWGYKLFAEYEKFSSQDWAIDGLGVDGISSVLTMGAHSPKYNIWYFKVQASYRF
jgi:MtrB/PioB family decaheme-associated outer membrane protein